MFREGFLRHAEHVTLDGIGIADDAAGKNGTRTRNGRYRVRDSAAGARLRRRARLLPLSEDLHKLSGRRHLQSSSA
jgi:hypothetical protein